MKRRARLAIDQRRPLRHAVEIRHESFVDDSFVELLREHGIALVIAETAKRWSVGQNASGDGIAAAQDRAMFIATSITPT